MKTLESSPQLNAEQSAAITAILSWLTPDSPLTAPAGEASTFFTLSGSAGTGKTFCVRHLITAFKGRVVFTATTNKATKVLRESVTTDAYKPECRTIYSLLGLHMDASGEVKQLKAREDPVDLSLFRLVVVDEAGMVNAQLFQHLKVAAANFKLKFLFLGDPAQLPPVGEASSAVWALEQKAELTTVMRHDNAILTLATKIRKQVYHPAPSIVLATDWENGEGVQKLSSEAFNCKITRAALEGKFQQPETCKVVCWRNVTVDQYNTLIRKAIFPEVTDPWAVGDRVLFLRPGKDADDKPMVSTDDEGLITHVATGWSLKYPDFKVWRLAITLDSNKTVVARVLHEDSAGAYQREVEALATAARATPRKWKQFWEFQEDFHGLRYAYAVTAHRAQGSTYDTTFVDWRDILINRNRHEGMRCLYVACTRSQKVLILN